MVDPISDMLTRIRNAQAVGHKTVSFPFSKIKYELANIFSKQGYLGAVNKKGRGVKREIEVILKPIQGLKRLSKPGLRLYADKRELNKFYKEKGVTVLSTSQGLMSIQNAKKKGVGGEVICRIW